MAKPQTVFPGDKFSRLTVLALCDERRNGARCYECLCDCGELHVVSGKHLTSGHTQSCGCIATERFVPKRHGFSRTPTYESWRAMKRRCSDPKVNGYQYYGGRGITVCEEWLTSFDAFLRDLGPRPEGRTLDRIDVNGNYEPGNCRWATAEEQTANRRATA